MIGSETSQNNELSKILNTALIMLVLFVCKRLFCSKKKTELGAGKVPAYVDFDVL